MALCYRFSNLNTFLFFILFVIPLFLISPLHAIVNAKFDAETKTLTITTSDGDNVRVWCSDNLVWVNGFPPQTGEVKCADIKRITIMGDDKDNSINVSKIDSCFSNLEYIEIDGKGGDDTVYGSQLLNHINGGDGDDTLFGGPKNDSIQDGNGNDTLYGGMGDDKYTIEFGGNDKIEDSDGYDTLDFTKTTSSITFTQSFPDSMPLIYNGRDTLKITGYLERFIGSKQDDTFKITGGCSFDIHIDGSNHNDGDNLIVDAQKKSVVEEDSVIIVGTFAPIHIKNIENITLLNVQATHVISSVTDIPKAYKLEQNYPNPFNASTSIEFHLPHKAFVQSYLYNINGKLVKTLTEQQYSAGRHKIIVSSTLPSGLYLYTLKTNQFYAVKRMMLLK